MRTFTIVAAIACLSLSRGASAQQAAPSTPGTPAYSLRCSACHGPTMTGAAGPSILTYVRYHTNAEIEAVLRTRVPRHPAVTLSDDELRAVLADLRALAGTNPNMATGGFTGRRTGGGGGTRGVPPAAASGAGAAAAGRGRAGGGGRGGRGASGPATISLADGRTLSGTMVAQSEFDATLLAEGRFYLLSREGPLYREKPIAPKADWLIYDGGYTGNRFSPLEQINAGNVGALAPAWIFPMTTPPRFETTPVVADGIMYLTGWNELHAIDATSGRSLWSHSQPPTEGLLGDAGTGANRGAAISGDLVLMVTDHAHLLAFNRFTGQKVWDVEMGSHKDGYSATAAPLVVGALVIQGVAGGDEGARGFVDAYRAATGERVWRFYTIPKRGEKGSETWKGQAIDHGCGGTWLTGSYDATLDLLYWAVGNPCPLYNGEERLGDNLYTASVVALAAQTGELKWHYQFTPHDTHDWDATQPMLLVDEMWQGRPRKLLLNGNRNGMFYVLDRTTGEFLLGDRLSTKVTWNLGFTKEGRPIVDPGSVSTREGVAVCPGATGGANFPAAAFSPETKLFYTRVSDSCGVFTSHEDPLGVAGDRWRGGGVASDKAQQALAALQSGYGGTFIRAMNPFTGKKVWDYPASGGRSGVLATGGGLLFVGGSGGLVAVDAKSGKAVWHFNTGQSSSAGPMTFMVGGKQYVVLAGSGGIVAYALRSEK
jgi:alcohol dehydrogenase (cytochrome c)